MAETGENLEMLIYLATQALFSLIFSKCFGLYLRLIATTCTASGSFASIIRERRENGGVQKRKLSPELATWG